MKMYSLLVTVLLCNVFGTINAQIGIGTATPDASAILDLTATNKGFLLPRMTAVEQAAVINPALGLTIFNTTSGQLETNVGTTAENVLWTGPNIGTTAVLGTNTKQFATTQYVLSNTNQYHSVTSNSTVLTVSPIDELIPEMILSPPAGTYMVYFNSEFTNKPQTIPSITTTTTVPYDSAQGVLDLEAVYIQLMAIATTNATHTITFGSGETLLPGVYSTAAALSIAGVLTLDGGGDPNSVFIFRSSAAIDTGAGTSIVLKNGASACNVFWIAEGAIGLGAGTIMKGTLISHGGAVAMGAGGSLEGRLFSTFGAIAFGPGTAIPPTNCSSINLGILDSFVIFTSSGALNGTGISYITGNLGTNHGIIGGFSTSIIDGTVLLAGAGIITTTVITPMIVSPSATATFSLYQGGELIVDSIRKRLKSNHTSEISLQSLATIKENEPIEVRWNVSTGILEVRNKIFTLINVR
ncbi:ice-binding family protein [Flavobacterium sp. W20_MBD1_R3]|uniref:ice-binding family protein n=1 Tax=Flavobacterium sp. W20_MBD1_R3 TaxID=3240278 RepID=UPI003F8E7718